MHNNSSPAVTFLTTARDAMPATVGERVYASSMCDLLSIAIKTRMVFERDDGATLDRLDHHSSVGVFRATDERYYSVACQQGGTYPAMWEKHHGIKPWKATLLQEGRRAGRVAPGISLLLPKDAEEDAKAQLESAGVFAVWRCTSISDSKIVLGRYRDRWQRRGGPKKRLTLTRERWDQLQAELAKEKK